MLHVAYVRIDEQTAKHNSLYTGKERERVAREYLNYSIYRWRLIQYHTTGKLTLVVQVAQALKTHVADGATPANKTEVHTPKILEKASELQSFKAGLTRVIIGDPARFSDLVSVRQSYMRVINTAPLSKGEGPVSEAISVVYGRFPAGSTSKPRVPTDAGSTGQS